MLFLMKFRSFLLGTIILRQLVNNTVILLPSNTTINFFFAPALVLCFLTMDTNRAGVKPHINRVVHFIQTLELFGTLSKFYGLTPKNGLVQ